MILGDGCDLFEGSDPMLRGCCWAEFLTLNRERFFFHYCGINAVCPAEDQTEVNAEFAKGRGDRRKDCPRIARNRNSVGWDKSARVALYFVSLRRGAGPPRRVVWLPVPFGGPPRA